jgi:predicted dehydrogenase
VAVSGSAPVRVAVLGAGFWARYQLAGWRELPGVEIAAVYNRTRDKAERLAAEFDIRAVYDDPLAMIAEVRPDVLDVVTGVETHARFVHLAAEHRVPVISQKPMAATLSEAEGMVRACREVGVPFFVHENWRWQTPIRRLKAVLDGGQIGRVFRARIDFVTGFAVFANQPFLRELEQFILTDIGSHILDAARFLFGEMTSLYCRTGKVHADIRGEDVATVVMTSRSGATVVCNMAYAGNALEHDRFPETYVFAEGTSGSAELGPDFWVRTTTEAGTHAKRYPPPHYAWADPAYDVVQASIVPCNANLLKGVRGEPGAETTGDDNLKTVRLVFGAYESAASGKVLNLPPADGGEANG